MAVSMKCEIAGLRAWMGQDDEHCLKSEMGSLERREEGNLG